MTATLEQLEHDPMILRRALDLGETVQIFRDGEVVGHLTPVPRPIPKSPVDGKSLWDLEEMRAWSRSVWGDRVFTDAEEQEMRDAEDGIEP